MTKKRTDSLDDIIDLLIPIAFIELLIFVNIALVTVLLRAFGVI